MIEKVPLSAGGVEYGQQLSEPAERIRGKTTLLVPEFKHLQSVTYR